MADPLKLVALNIVTVVVFVGVAAIMQRRANSPTIRPRNVVEARTFPALRAVGVRGRMLFAILLAIAVAAPWITYLLSNRT